MHVVLDDDPTGTQAVAGVPVVLVPSRAAFIAADATGARAVHVLTNTRALEAPDARAATARAARAARTALPGARLVLRGDSTLRAHLLPELLGVQDALGAPTGPLVLVPALPAAGRITRHGVQLLRRDGDLVPLHETEYAQDGPFAYDDAHLLRWAEHRSDGALPASRGAIVTVAQLRRDGPRVLVDTIARLAAGSGPAACAVDAETEADLELVAEAVRAAEAASAPFLVRCGPALAGALTGTLAADRTPVDPPARRVLVVCGSYVPQTTRQLAALQRRGLAVVEEADLTALGAASGEARRAEVARLARAAEAQIERHGVAVVATPRRHDRALAALDVGRRIAGALAAVPAAMSAPPDLVISKGGITSAVMAASGLGVEVARVIGPIAPGVALWEGGTTGTGRRLAVFPGNVGDDDALADLVDLATGGPRQAGSATATS